ncbi:MAG: hypothetical protein H6722_11820 [Sandaracinus sp.]|nr:hypothetical protein [Sandaracinus sp.]MCB9613132.1 hypothetical protein [Sandaracinus sp.]
MRRTLLLLLLLGGCAHTTELVSVDWLGRGVHYAGRVVERRSGLTHVRYADGEHEWVTGDRLGPLPELVGRRVAVHTGVRIVEGSVTETHDGLIHLQLDDGGTAWFGAESLYRLDSPPSEGEPSPTDPAPEIATRPPTTEPVTAGAGVLAYWVSDGELDRTRPWLATVVSVGADRALLRYSDGTEADVPTRAILRVFVAVSTLEVGRRYWFGGEHPLGTVLESRGDLYRVDVGDEEIWTQAPPALGEAPSIPLEQLTAGVHVTVRWSSTSLYFGRVVGVEDGAVRVAWFDGSEPTLVELGAIGEVW